MFYFILDQLVFLFQWDCLHINYVVFGVCFKWGKAPLPPSYRTGAPVWPFFPHTTCPISVTWVLTQLRQWKIRLHFSVLIAIPPKQCNQGLMCTYNFILDISLTAIYCLKGKGGRGGGRGSYVPLPPKQTQQLIFEGRVFAKSKQMAIIMGFTYVLS